MGLPIWFLTTIEPVEYDSYEAHVVAAATEEKARAMVPCGDECRMHPRVTHSKKCVWRDGSKTHVECIGSANANRPIIILSSYKAG